MGGFVKGEVVVIPFPFSDLSASKRRPALVVASLSGGDVILCVITSKAVRDRLAIPVSAADFVSGGLPLQSNIRPNRLFTADSRIVLRSAGRISDEKLRTVINAIVEILNS